METIQLRLIEKLARDIMQEAEDMGYMASPEARIESWHRLELWREEMGTALARLSSEIQADITEAELAKVTFSDISGATAGTENTR